MVIQKGMKTSEKSLMCSQSWAIVPVQWFWALWVLESLGECSKCGVSLGPLPDMGFRGSTGLTILYWHRFGKHQGLRELGYWFHCSKNSLRYLLGTQILGPPAPTVLTLTEWVWVLLTLKVLQVIPMIRETSLSFCVSQSVAPRPAASVPCGNLLEIQIWSSLYIPQIRNPGRKGFPGGSVIEN